MRQNAQAQARRAAGRLLTDTESYLLDVSLAESLLAGLSAPQQQTDGCDMPGADRPGGAPQWLTTGPALSRYCARGQRCRPTSRQRVRAAAYGTRSVPRRGRGRLAGCGLLDQAGSAGA